MEQTKRSRKAVRTVFKKTANVIQELSSTTDVQVEEIRLKWILLQDKHKALMELDQQIYEGLVATVESDAELVREMETADTYETIFQKVKNDVSKLLDKPPDVNTSLTTLPNEIFARKFKLPVLEVKKFGGEIKDWLPFWNQFQKIHCDTSIPAEDKFQYLQQATIVGTRAREVVDSFPLSRDNYAKAIEALQSRFGKDELLIEVYVREMLKLVLHNTIAQEKQGLSVLYDKLETQLRALESLGVTTEKYEAMLFPLVESALPEEVLRIWQRSAHFSQQDNPKGGRLDSLMSFIRNEVEAEQRIALATEGFKLDNEKSRKGKRTNEYLVSTATGLINYTEGKCIFCEGGHASENCFKAQKMTLEEKRQVLSRKKACFRCIKIGHQRRNCHERVKCIICGKQHVVMMCSELKVGRTEERSNITNETDTVRKNEKPEISMSNLTNPTGTDVFLQTLRVRMYSQKGNRIVRAIYDGGSQRSYVLTSTARSLNYPIKNSEKVMHNLFSGAKTDEQTHHCYTVRVASLNGDFACNFEARDSPIICNDIYPVHEGIWTKELKKQGIELTDTDGCEPIELLIGADVAGKLYTEKRKELKCGLVAMYTQLGWVLMGKTPNKPTHSNTSMTVTSLLNRTMTIKDWWDLDILGITEPKDRKNEKDVYQLTKETFQKTITVTKEGRYEVGLPWIEEHPPLPSNETLAKERLQRTLTKLQQNGYQEQYQEVLNEWCTDGIIEQVVDEKEKKICHYLPHRPVIKENSSTKVRPVFDASAREKGAPALNDCLENGENLIELIPKILIKFRVQKFGVIADIKKAFLQISLHDNDCDFLRFFWKNKEGVEIIFRHKRVVFGVNSSPFILAATIDYHLNQCLINAKTEHNYSQETVQKLMDSFYVDNCVTSVDCEDELNTFIEEATTIMNEGKFELRGWEHTNDFIEEKTYVLGLLWSKREDTLSISYNEIGFEDKKITKRTILAVAQRVFDPIGFTCPTCLYPKLLLQSLWEKKISWDEEVDEETQIKFKRWLEELHCLREIKIPRWFHIQTNSDQDISLHTFCDASNLAYAAVVFLRIKTPEGVMVHLVLAKARVAPLKRLSIPRLELLAATVGARLWSQVAGTLKLKVKSYFWTDASTVLSWIKRQEEWSIFVWNRVEIRRLTNSECWNHVPGEKNPADLLSRGCSPKTLKTLKWWEGPKWLYEEETSWPKPKIVVNEEEINIELKKKANKSLLSTVSCSRLYTYFSSYMKNVRMIAWMFSFSFNCRNPTERKMSELSTKEIEEAEKTLIKTAQASLLPLKRDVENTLNVFHDEEGLLRVKTRLVNREDTKEFLYPYLMPAKHLITERLIYYMHVNACHVKGQGLMSLLRERFWILGGRHSTNSNKSLYDM